MSIADKLLTVAQNQQAVYDAGRVKSHELWLNQTITQLNEPGMTEIGSYQFYGFKALEKAIFPAVITAGMYAFCTCSALREANFPLLESVPERMLRSTAVEVVDLPKATSIAALAFSYSHINTLILRSASLCTLANVNAFSGTTLGNGNGYIYVPSALVDTYKAATNWSSYADRIYAIEDYTVDGTVTGELSGGVQ